MKRVFVDQLFQRLTDHPRFIQVVLGPRQVGKTTGVLQLEKLLPTKTVIYENADSVFSHKTEWLKECWLKARISMTSKGTILIIDEVQNIPQWSTVIKGLWDQDLKEKRNFHVILLGSSSLELHQGLSESLAGRFELLYVPHWSYQESRELCPSLTLKDYLEYGGYPAPLTITDPSRRNDYLRNSILEPVITRDILQNATVKKPGLFRQTFELACLHAGEVLSLNKFLGQLQEGGNVDLVKHYLNLYQQAFLLITLEKYSTNRLQRKGSSPKLLPTAPAFLNLFSDFDLGRRFEVAVGLHLVNKYKNVTYWREGDKEVDFVLKLKKSIVAIEVKAGKKQDGRGLEAFSKKFECKTLMVTMDSFEKIDEIIELV
jgi:uncharacterized protein